MSAFVVLLYFLLILIVFLFWILVRAVTTILALKTRVVHRLFMRTRCHIILCISVSTMCIYVNAYSYIHIRCHCGNSKLPTFVNLSSLGCSIFRSTLQQSRSDKAGLTSPSVSPSVHKKFLRFQWNLAFVGRGRWVMHDGMQYDWSKVKVTSPSKLEIRPHLKAISSVIYNRNWQLTTDS